VLDSMMGNSAAITVPAIAGTQLPFIFAGQQALLSANKSIVVAVVIDTFSATSGSFNVCLGSAASLSITTGDWAAVIPVIPTANPGFVIFGFGLNFGSTVPVYQSTTFDFSVLVVNPVTTPVGMTCRMYLVGVNF
jgi:hypothetical protein